jgi:hypothetical protein
VSVLFANLVKLACVVIFAAAAAFAQSQSNAADLTGTVVDPNGAIIPGATVMARNLGTNITRTVSSGDDGIYSFIGLPPGEYEVTAEAPTFSKVAISPVRLTVGQTAELKISMRIGAQDAVVNVPASEVELVETTKTSVSNTIDQRRIENLPINERSATGFALTISTVGRDNGRPIGPAPTSGLNIGGQRGRSTLVQVDGADFTDNSINAARSTVSQEAVQEYQVTTNSYLPEFGRATGGIVNVVTKSGTNDFRGNLFGFIRDKSIQARNPFAPVIDGDPSKKAPYTRVQYGGTFGGPVIKDRAFFFFSVEQRRRQESGFFTGDIIGNQTASITIGAPFLPASQTFTGLTPAQVAYIQATLPTNPSFAVAYATLASVGAQTALNGSSNLVNFLPGIGVPQGQMVGSRFILSGQPIPLTRNADGELVAFRPLTQLRRIFPISEDTTYTSLRYDHQVAQGHQMTLRVGYNPSTITGIQDESQNQTLGQNDYSRTGVQDIKDTSVSASLTSLLPYSLVNDWYFSFGRRKATFDSAVPSVAHQIAGTAFIGSNPFSPVNRTETRFQIRDNLTFATGNHTVKGGVDFNWLNVDARFELNFPALFNFSQQAGGSLVNTVNAQTGVTTGCDSPSFPEANRCPAFTANQTYGLGFPSVFIEGFGNPNSKIRNRPIAFFIQDTWKVFRNFTLNYGVRYDVELTEQVAPTAFRDPLTGIPLSEADILAAQDALGVTQGFPRDTNNWAPRVGAAWDVFGNGKTVLRGAAGLFFDHPLLAVAFNSDIADSSQQQQSTLVPIGGPSPLGLLNAFQVFQGTLINCNFAGAIPGTNCTPGLAPTANYLRGFQRFDPATFTGFGPILPFSLPVAKDFRYPEAFQTNLGIEQMIGKDMSLSVNYIGVQARFLNHPRDINAPNTANLIENFRRFAGRNPTNFSEAAFFSIPAACPGAGCPPGFTVLIPRILGRNGLGQTVVSGPAANYFRPSGPNYFFVSALTGGAVGKPAFDALLAGSVRTPGPVSPYGEVNAQVSDGYSSYNALNVEVKRRFSTNIQFLATYTWSHSIDDSSDLQTLLKPQNNNNLRNDRSDSLFDQRHRFVFSGVVASPEGWRSQGGYKRWLHGFSFAPIVEFGSGRPFNILAVGDANGDLQSSNERPSVLADGTLCQTAVDPGCFQGVFPAEPTLGRNLGITHSYFSVDARLTRRIKFGERVNLDLIAEVFNLFNRFNEASANPFYQVVNAWGERSGGRYFSRPTSAFDPRQFQFGFKLNF